MLVNSRRLLVHVYTVGANTFPVTLTYGAACIEPTRTLIVTFRWKARVVGRAITVVLSSAVALCQVVGFVDTSLYTRQVAPKLGK